MEDLISLEGAYDLHVHTHPCLFPRLTDDEGAVRAAAQAGLAGILLKCHHESTVSRARALQAQYPDLQVYGGIVLNGFVGGINPEAVEAALRMGARQVWMPTTDAKNHAVVHGSRGKYDVQDGRKDAEADLEGITIYGADGTLSEATREVLKLVAEHDAILGTCHLSPEEIFDLVREARALGVRKILITHPFFKVPSLDLPALQELTNMGAIAEFGYCTVSPMWHYATVQTVAETIRTLGARHCIIMSDGGQRHNPMPAEGLRIFAQCLYECGIGRDELDILMRENPAVLVSS